MKRILLFLLILTLVGTTVVWIRYGGGAPYPDLSTAPALRADALEDVLEFAEPVGNVELLTRDPDTGSTILASDGRPLICCPASLHLLV